MPYFAQNQPEFNCLRHLQLLPYAASAPFTKDDLSRHVAHFNSKGKPDAPQTQCGHQHALPPPQSVHK
ncbi:MAG: hypothetical protein WCK47_07420 [bacterium]